MFIASAVNVGESVFFINIDNEKCYDSYSSDLYLDIFIFLLIRIISHYLFLISCLYIFRIENPRQFSVDINSESASSFKLATYNEEVFSEGSLKSEGHIKFMNRFST